MFNLTEAEIFKDEDWLAVTLKTSALEVMYLRGFVNPCTY
jgi:hypothetical protein